jgi:hypothetical protein
MAERITGPLTIGGPPASSLLWRNKVQRLPGIPAGSLVFLAATGVIGVVLAGCLFVSCFSLLAPPPAPMRPAAPISTRTGRSPEPAVAVAAAVSPNIGRTAPASPLPGPSIATLPLATPTLSGRDIARATARGEAFFQNGDLAVARFFFQLAADARDRQAALRLGESFDPAFLPHRAGGGELKAAVYWYRRALDLGAGEAASHLDRLGAATSR